jgi:hypothetical protein
MGMSPTPAVMLALLIDQYASVLSPGGGSASTPVALYGRSPLRFVSRPRDEGLRAPDAR